MATVKREPKFAGIVANEKVTRRKKTTSSEDNLLEAIVHGMAEVKAHDIVVLDLKEIPHSVADFFVICHGNSNTQVQAIAGSVEKETESQIGERPSHVEGERNAKWILMDYVNIVVHIFDKESRFFYGLEELWADAKMNKIES